MNWKKHDDFARVCRLAGQAVVEFRMIAEGDRIVVGLSGGKDSYMLMHVLDRLRQRSPVHFELVAVTVDMGFRAFDAGPVGEYCARHGWRWEWVRLPGRELLREKQADERPCSLCSRLRRGQLHAAADRLEAGTIALGQHLDDLCVSLLLSLYRGGGLKTMGANVAADHGRKRLIRPLCRVSESLIRDAARPFGFPIQPSCDFAAELEHGDRAYLKAEIERLESRFPGVRHAMLHGMSDLRPAHLLDTRFLQLPGGVVPPVTGPGEEGEE